jgi:hypothetical protein
MLFCSLTTFSLGISNHNSSGLGIAVISADFNGHHDVSGLESGIFFVSFDFWDHIITKKWVKINR